MSVRHSYTKSQIFASPGVVITKSVRQKLPRRSVNGLTDRSSVNVVNSHLPPDTETACQLTTKEDALYPALNSIKDAGSITSTNAAGLDENGNPVEAIVTTGDHQACSAPTVSLHCCDSGKSVESDCIVTTSSGGRQTTSETGSGYKSSSTFARCEQHKAKMLSKTTDLTYMATPPRSEVQQNAGYFDLKLAQIFLYDAYKEVLQLKSRGLATVYSSQS